MECSVSGICEKEDYKWEELEVEMRSHGYKKIFSIAFYED